MKKILIFLIQIAYISCQPINLNKLKQDFAKDNDFNKFAFHKNQIINYYESNEFEKEIDSICKKALKHFLSINKKTNDAIIFDIDETCLSNYPFFKEKNFIWELDEEVVQFRQKMVCPAINPVFNLYKELIKNDFKIIFLSSRRDSLYKATQLNLINTGFTKFEELILLPMKLLLAGVKHEQWKAERRKELSLKYDIVGSVSDSQKDFLGGNTGQCVKIPNYLY